MAEALGISDVDVRSDAFAAFFSGDQSRISGLDSWCTPYALSIMGQPQYQNCPFGNGNGYGDVPFVIINRNGPTVAPKNDSQKEYTNNF